MYNIWVRSSVIFFYTLSILFIASMGSVFTAFFHEGHSNLGLSNIDVTHLRNLHQDSTELAAFRFDMDVDLSSEWNWNLKQLFVFVTLSYETSKHTVNDVVIWDKIIQTPEEAKFSQKRVRSKYVLKDFDQELRGINANLTFHWEVMPLIGFVKFAKTDTQQIKFHLKFPNKFK